jgi:hypothetical protein
MEGVWIETPATNEKKSNEVVLCMRLSKVRG